MGTGSKHAWLLALADPAGPRQEALPGGPLTAKGLAALCALADRHGVLPALLANLRQVLAQDGGERLVQVPGRDRDGPFSAAMAHAEERVVQRTAFTMLLRQQTNEVAAALLGASVPVLVLKGADFAARLYPRPALRPYTDVDLMIPEGATAQADRVMEGLGYQPAAARMKYASGYGERAWWRPQQVAGMVEIHWDLVNSPSLRKAVSVAYEDLQLAGPVGARGLPQASPASLLLIAAVHGATGHGFDRLQILYDVAQAARGAAGTVDETWLADAARRTGAAVALSMALDLGRRILQEPRCGDLADRLRLPDSGWLCRAVLTPGVVLRGRARVDGIRRQAFREILKRS